MEKLLNYSQGWAQVLMSIVLIVVGVLLVLWPTTDAGTKSVGIGLVVSVSGAWVALIGAHATVQKVKDEIPQVIKDAVPPAISTQPLGVGESESK